MSVRKRGNRWQARLMIDGRAFAASFPTREAAEQWETITRAQAIQGSLPTSVTVGWSAAGADVVLLDPLAVHDLEAALDQGVLR